MSAASDMRSAVTAVEGPMKRWMGRTEFLTRTIQSEPRLERAKPIYETKWRSSMSACRSVLENCLTVPTLLEMESRVENRRSDCSLPVDIRRSFRRATSVRFGLVLFPVPAHRTGQADFPHPALGKDTRCSV